MATLHQLDVQALDELLQPVDSYQQIPLVAHDEGPWPERAPASWHPQGGER
jgi:hypothetical protein